MLMTGDWYDDHQDPDNRGHEVSLLLISLVALMAWLLVAACVESAQVVVP